MTRLARVARAARSLLPADVAVAVEDPDAPATGLWPEEATAITRAVPKRQREFAAGRRATRRAMAELGQPEGPIPMGPDRAPSWPSGIVGSISHTDGCCVAVVARSGLIRAIGIDLEPDAPLESDLWESICTPNELAWLKSLPPIRQGPLARRLFSAKEAAYKAQYPLTNTLLEFGAIEIRGLAQPRLEANFTADLALTERNPQLSGYLQIAEGLVITAVVVAGADQMI